MALISFISFRFGGTDGVAIESAKWIDALQKLGHEILTIAGEGTADVLLPGLARDAVAPPAVRDVEQAISAADLVIVENLCSLPLNPLASDAVYAAIKNRRAILHHHDLPWQRPHLAHVPGPHDNPRWRHITINELSSRELAGRGIASEVIRNHFDTSPPIGYRDRTRKALGISSEPLLLFPSRVIPRKNVGAALELADALDATLWILGPTEDGYEDALAQLVAERPVHVVQGAPTGVSIDDAYAACDLVVMPSTWEGFGNPVIESVTHWRPLALNWYPVAHEIADYGFSFFSITAVDAIRQELVTPDLARREQNWRVAHEHFDLQRLPIILDEFISRHFPSLAR